MESWMQHLGGTDRLKHLFNTEPSASECDIFEVNFNRNGPRVDVKINLTKDLNFKPEKWKDCNAVILDLGFYGISGVSMRGWSTDNTSSSINISKSGELLQVSFEYSHGEFSCFASTARLVDIQAYIVEQ